MRHLFTLFILAISLNGLAVNYSRNLSGTVLSADKKQPLAGVQIKVENSSNIAFTDAKGHYVITLPDDTNRIVFNLAGYKTDTIKVGTKNNLDAYLTKILQSNIRVKKHATTKIITGKITDANTGMPLQGTTIASANKGFIRADVNGAFTLTVPKELNLLSIMNVGYVTQQINIEKQTNFDTKLVPDSRSLKEVVIRGYVKRNRDETTGSSYIITGKEVQDNPVANVEQLLQGKVAGLQQSQAAKSYSYQAPVTGASYMRGTVNIRGLNVVNNEESYSRIIENQFIDPKTTPLSTFATDVDAASYANVRRFINAGQLPPKNAVRIEEMINYFKYNLPEPTSGEPVAIQTEVAAAPWNPQHQLVRIGLKAKEMTLDKLPPSNLVFLIDVSGSMDMQNKLPLVKTAMKMLVDQLRPIDNVAIVVYAGEVGVRLESTPASHKEKIKDVIDQLNAGGGTAGGAGIMMAYDIARKNFIKKGNNRIILATDGDFNVGPSTNKDMAQLIEEERGSGVSLSILGFGMGNYKDSKMELLADKGHGNYAYIDNITEATKSMVTEFGGTLFTIAKDVKLQVEFNPGKVQAYRLLGYEDRLMAKEDFNNDSKLGGDMGMGHTVTALYEIIPVGVKDNFTGTVDRLKYQTPEETGTKNTSPELMTIKFRYKQPDGDISKMQSVVINDRQLRLNNTSEDFRFAAAVAEYGMLLRDSQFKQDSKFEQVISMAKKAKGVDDNGYRAEFIRLAESTRDMMKTSQVVAAK